VDVSATALAWHGAVKGHAGSDERAALK